jgi:hypothetical protein
MTISTTESRISYNGNSATTVFSFPYRFLVNGDLVVVEVSAAGVEVVKTITTDYTITGAGDDAGGSVTMLAAPATGTRLVIYRDTEVVQETDYTSGDAFPAESHERALDRLTMILQEKTPGAAGATRAIQIPIGDPGDVNTVLPPSIARLGKFLIFDATTGSVGVSDVTSSQVEVAVEELGLVETTVNVFTKNQSVLPVALTSTSASIAVDASLSNSFTHTLTEDTTLANPTNLTDGMQIMFRFKQHASSAKTLAFGSKYKFDDGATPTIPVAVGTKTIMACYYDATDDELDCVFTGQVGFS